MQLSEHLRLIQPTVLSWVDTLIGNRSACGIRVIRAAAQSITNATVTAISFDTELIDTHSGFSPTDTKLRIVRSGHYICGGAWGMNDTQNAAAARVVTLIRVNGSRVIGVGETDSRAGEFVHSSATTGMTYLQAGDYIEICAYHTQAAAKNSLAATMLQQYYCHGWLMRVIS